MQVRLIVAAVALCLLGAAFASAAPPEVSARSYIVVNTETGDILAAEQPDRRLPMASTTKLMTAIVTLENRELSDVVTVPTSAAAISGSEAGLVAGERITVRNLLKGLMVGSGNDAALALADDVGGSESAFVAMMNDATTRLGLADTHFANPHGLDAAGHYSTVRDLVTLAEYAREQYPLIKAVVRNKTTTIPGPSGRGTRTLESENDLLDIDPRADGIKTGHTNGAGYAMVAHATDRTRKMGLYVALIGSSSRAQRAIDAKRLLDWGFQQYARPTFLRRDEVVVTLPVRDRPGVEIDVVPRGPLAATINLGESVTREFEVISEVVTPAHAGDRVGTVKYMVGQRVIGSRALVLSTDAAEPSIVERIRAGIGRIL